MARDTLGSLEKQVLQVLMLQPRDAYGVAIIERLGAITGKEHSVGAIYTTLDRLKVKGFVTSRMGEATNERGGRAKRYFEITADGRRAVAESEALSAAFQSGALPQGI